jgi:hypothetical protein
MTPENPCGFFLHLNNARRYAHTSMLQRCKAVQQDMLLHHCCLCVDCSDYCTNRNKPRVESC